jgi:hypothetical protein
MCDCKSFINGEIGDDFGEHTEVVVNFECFMCKHDAKLFSYHAPSGINRPNNGGQSGSDYHWYECAMCKTYIKVLSNSLEFVKEIFIIDKFSIAKEDGRIYIWDNNYPDDDSDALCAIVPEFPFNKENLLDKIKTCILFQ